MLQFFLLQLPVFNICSKFANRTGTHFPEGSVADPDFLADPGPHFQNQEFDTGTKIVWCAPKRKTLPVYLQNPLVSGTSIWMYTGTGTV